VKGFAGFLQQHDSALSEHLAELAGGLHSGLEKLLALDAPLIVGVNGPAAGAGMSLVLAADLAFGGPKARLTPAYPKIGFSSDGGMTYFLPRIVGERRAAEIMLLNRTLSAQEAAALGILVSVSDQEGEAFDTEVLDRAVQVAAGPRRAHGVIRRLLGQSAATSLSDQLAAEAKGMSELALGSDVREGVTALREKRGPIFGE
jgi:2-(1,2-epoxy-1,2-dihydrophenyl)acetyl-CoA isomerase